MSLSTFSKLPNLPTHMSTLSNLAETRMDKGFHKDAHLNTLNEQVDCSGGGGLKVYDFPSLDRVLNRIFTCGSFRRGVFLWHGADICMD